MIYCYWGSRVDQRNAEDRRGDGGVGYGVGMFVWGGSEREEQ